MLSSAPKVKLNYKIKNVATEARVTLNIVYIHQRPRDNKIEPNISAVATKNYPAIINNTLICPYYTTTQEADKITNKTIYITIVCAKYIYDGLI